MQISGCVLYTYVGIVYACINHCTFIQLWIKTYCAKVFDGLEQGTHPSELVQVSLYVTIIISATSLYHN